MMLSKNVAAYLYGIDILDRHYPIAEITDVTATITNAIDSTASCTLTGKLKPVKSFKLFEEFDNFINKTEDFKRGYELGKAVGKFYDYILGDNPIASGIEKVIFNPPATIVMWKDGTKTVVKCTEEDSFSEWAGLSLCISKKILGYNFHKTFKKWCKDEDPASDKSLEDFRTLKKTMDDLKKLEV